MGQTFVIRFGAVWVDELPEQWRYQPSHYLDHTISNVQSVEQPHRAICVKLVFLGADQSGILGAQFTPDSSNQLKIRIGVLNTVDTEKIVNTGLPEEFARIVLKETVLTFESRKAWGAGTLEFQHAAHHQVESSPYIFRLLTHTVITLLDPAFTGISAETISQTIQSLKTTLYEQRSQQ